MVIRCFGMSVDEIDVTRVLAFRMASDLSPLVLQEMRTEIDRLLEKGASCSEARTVLDRFSAHRRSTALRAAA